MKAEVKVLELHDKWFATLTMRDDLHDHVEVRVCVDADSRAEALMKLEEEVDSIKVRAVTAIVRLKAQESDDAADYSGAPELNVAAFRDGANKFRPTREMMAEDWSDHVSHEQEAK